MVHAGAAGAEASAGAVATAVVTAVEAEAAVAAATAALPAPPQVLLMPGQTVRSRKTTTAHRQQMTSRHVRMLPFGGYPAPQNDQLKCRKGKQRLTDFPGGVTPPKGGRPPPMGGSPKARKGWPFRVRSAENSPFAFSERVQPSSNPVP